jgi:hypothetical protein
MLKLLKLTASALVLANLRMYQPAATNVSAAFGPTPSINFKSSPFRCLEL